MEHIENLDSLVGLTEDELYVIAGRYVARGRMMATPPEKSTLKNFGKSRMRELMPEIQSRVCKNERLIEIAKKETDERTLIVSVLDVLSTLITGGVPLVVISALIIKIGLNRLCASS